MMERNYYYQNKAELYTADADGNRDSLNLVGTSSNVIATARGTGSSESWYLYNKDCRDSTSSIVDGSGELAAAYDYDEFGETTVITGDTFDNEICYTGQIYDKNTGLYYYNARFYDPQDGRFLTQDTYRGENKEPETLHLYAYCANDPMNYVDPSGHKLIAIGPNWEIHDSKPRGTPEKGWRKAKKKNGSKLWKLKKLPKKVSKKLRKRIGKKVRKTVKKKVRKTLLKVGLCVGSGLYGAVMKAESINRFASNAIIDAIALSAPVKNGKQTVWFTITAKDVYSTSGSYHWIKTWATYYKDSERKKKIKSSKVMYLYERMGAC